MLSNTEIKKRLLGDCNEKKEKIGGCNEKKEKKLAEVLIKRKKINGEYYDPREVMKLIKTKIDTPEDIKPVTYKFKTDDEIYYGQGLQNVIDQNVIINAKRHIAMYDRINKNNENY